MSPSATRSKTAPSDRTTKKGDTKGDTDGTSKNEKKGLSLSAYVVQVLKAEPDRTIHYCELAEKTGGKVDTVKRLSARLASTGKGSGPVRRGSPGFYQYDPAKDDGGLMALTRSGWWRIENIMFVSSKTQSPSVSPSEPNPDEPKGTPSDTHIPVPKQDYPYSLATGHEVFWGTYDNGTEIIRISANGNPPISIDFAIQIIASLQLENVDEWLCKSLEVNVDSQKIRIDASYSMQVIEGLLLKCYQHGYNTRLEIADRRKVSMREVLELFHSLASSIDGREALRQVAQVDKRLSGVEKSTRYAVNTIAKLQDQQGSRSSRTTTTKPGTKQVAPAPSTSFKTGTEIRQARSSTATALGASQ